jgi:hypothetical protein
MREYLQKSVYVDNNNMHQNYQLEDLIKKMIAVSISGLIKFFNYDTNLFYEKVVCCDSSLVFGKLSPRYTLITLLGLHKYEKAGNKFPITLETILESVNKKAKEFNSIGDIGLHIWALSLLAPDKLQQYYDTKSLLNSLKTCIDAKNCLTTEIAWFLTGLSQACLTLPKSTEQWKKLAIRTHNMLNNNYYGKGIFGHMNSCSIKGRIRGRIGCFADQVYPILALSTFSKIHDNSAVNNALECAKTICKLQGAQGQWWWHYDAFTGKVIGQYPVYATHQNGMAPMALFALNEVSDIDFSKAIYKGLGWINKSNEIEFDFIDAKNNVIWRCLQQNKYKMYLQKIKSFLLKPNDNRNQKKLVINRQCRPYHLGWLLYAFSDKI